MPEPSPTNLLRVFDFYLFMMFLLSFALRWRVYWDTVRLVVSARARWPKLIEQMGQHHQVVLNWAFFRPAIVALALMVVQLVCSRMVWPQAHLSGGELTAAWWPLPVLAGVGGAMVAVDLFFLIRIGTFDRAETSKYLDKAEGWLGWRAWAVRAATLGLVNPRRIVDQEVKKNLEELGSTVRSALWWVSVQTGLRLLTGLALWTVWAVHGAGS